MAKKLSLEEQKRKEIIDAIQNLHVEKYKGEDLLLPTEEEELAIMGIGFNNCNWEEEKYSFFRFMRDSREIRQRIEEKYKKLESQEK